MNTNGINQAKCDKAYTNKQKNSSDEKKASVQKNSYYTEDSAVLELTEAAKEEELDKTRQRLKNREEEQLQLKELLEQLIQQKEAFKKAFERNRKKSVSYNAGPDMSAIASADTVGQVTAIRARLHAKALRLRRQGGNPKQLRAALIRIGRVIGKAEVKITNLNQEDRLEGEQKKAKKKQELKREQKIKLELEKRRKLRKAKEHSDAAACRKGQGVNYVSEAEINSFSDAQFEVMFPEISAEAADVNVSDTSASDSLSGSSGTEAASGTAESVDISL